jgi:large subunit ribosomal protein L11
MEFCKAFNAATQQMEPGSPIPGDHHGIPGQVVLVRDEDPSGILLPEEGGQDQVWPQGARQGLVIGKVTRAQVREIAEKKMVDLNARDLDQAEKIIAGSARSMGLEVVG